MNCKDNEKQKIGIVSPVPKGNWLPTIMYYQLNIVSHNNAVYIAKDKNVGVEPNLTTGWQNHWMLLINLQDIIIENIPQKTSELDNDGNGESPFVTEKSLENSLPKNIAVTDKNNFFSENQTFNKDVSVVGNLIVQGTTTTQDSETLQVKDKFIVVNSDGDDIQTLTGVVIRVNETTTFGIVYNPQTQLVQLGKGEYVNGEFTLNEIAGNVATWNDLIDGYLVEWQSNGNRLVNSGKKITDLATFRYVDGLISTEKPTRLENNTHYILTTSALTSITIEPPTTFDENFICDMKFITGDTISLITQNITYKGRDCLADGTFDIQPNTNYYINFMAYNEAVVGFVAKI